MITAVRYRAVTCRFACNFVYFTGSAVDTIWFAFFRFKIITVALNFNGHSYQHIPSWNCVCNLLNKHISRPSDCTFHSLPRRISMDSLTWNKLRWLPYLVKHSYRFNEHWSTIICFQLDISLRCTDLFCLCLFHLWHF